MKRLLNIIFALAYVLGISGQGVTVHSDSTVTFKANFPDARKVIIEGSFCSRAKAKTCNAKFKKGGYVMKKTEDGWICHTQPLSSEMYTYRYIVDGHYMLDPANPHTVRDIADTLNYFFVQGNIADNYIEHDIPHGTVEKVWYPSTMNGMSQRRMFVYLPPSYADSLSTSYPVLYLLHGSGGDETSWTDFGRAAQILDNMINKGECKHLIVVMPNGNATLDAAPGESPYMDREPQASNVSSMLGMIETAFPNEIIRYTERHYRVCPGKSNRAIAGLSLGGLQTIFIAANNPDLFDYIGLFSAQTKDILTLISQKSQRFITLMQYRENHIKLIKYVLKGKLPSNNKIFDKFKYISIYDSLEQKLLRQYQDPPKLYYVAIGRDDFMRSKILKKRFSTLQKNLDSHHLPYEFHLTDGTHSWENWRKYLVEFLPKLFL